MNAKVELRRFLLSGFCAVLAASLCFAAVPDRDRDNSLFDYFFIEAVNQGRQGNFAEAFDLLQHCLELNPESAASKYELAQYYMLLGDKTKPGELMRDAVALEPDNYWYWELLGTYYGRTHQYVEAIGVYEKMVLQFPARTDILFGLMNLYESAGEYSKGLAVLDRIETIEGESLQGSLQRFQFYLNMNRVDSAYMAVRPHVEWVIENMSENVSSLAELNAVRSLCRLALADMPDNLKIHYRNALSDVQAGEKDKGYADIEAGIARISADSDPVDAARLYTLRGDLYYSDGDMGKAFQSYEKALEYNPADNMTANNYAYFLSLDKRDLDKAEKLSRKTIEDEPMNATYLDTYAWILFARKQYKEALEYIDRAVMSGDEPAADVMEHCGDIHYMNGDVEGAVRYWHEAVELHSESKTIEQKIFQRKYIE